MIKYPYTTYFDQQWPTLEPKEKIKIYHHPELPLWTNQIGFINFDDPNAYIVESTRAGVLKSGGQKWQIGTHSKLIYECYHNTVIKFAQVTHLNCNQYDYTKENLYVPNGKSDPKIFEYRKLKTIVTDNTVRYMLKKSNELVGKGFDPFQYWELALVEKDLVKKWQVLFERETSVYL